MKNLYPCDGADGYCPYNAVGGDDCVTTVVLA